MRNQRNLVGNKYGRLLVIESCGQERKGTHYMSKVRCECGKEYLVPDTELIYGRRTSCKECSHPTQTHGKTHTKLFDVWQSMKQRCYDKHNNNYKNYGGRGIRICDEWLSNFMNFYNWAMDNGYQKGLSIDRIDVNGNYEPSNCRWVTMKEQASNKRNNHLITYKGETKHLQYWANKFNINSTTIYNRLKSGWDIEKAFNLEPKVGRNQYDK